MLMMSLVVPLKMRKAEMSWKAAACAFLALLIVSPKFFTMHALVVRLIQLAFKNYTMNRLCVASTILMSTLAIGWLAQMLFTLVTN